MVGQTLGPLPKYWTIGRAEHLNVLRSLKKPLSGYVGGKHEAGYWVTRLAEEWQQEFNVKHAIPCNSATSGLLASCMAAGVGAGDEVWVSTYTMSATATCAKVLGAKVILKDIDPEYFCLGRINIIPEPNPPKAVIVTNLFGCAARLPELRHWCDQLNIALIEDNAQAPYATCGGRYTGTIGHMGVFSLNIHKFFQCGEGGVVVTDDDNLALRIKDVINHGELRV